MKTLLSCAVFASLLLVGCGSSKSEKKTYVCDLNDSLTLKSSALKVSQNTLELSSKILMDMNATLEKINRMNEAIYETMDVSAQTLEKVAKPFSISDEGAKIFTINSFTPSYIAIKQPLTKKYILVSSANRFFPDGQSVKTLFSDGTTLSNALQKAFNESDSSKNLYLTILQIESNQTLTNLTNGLLIQR